MATAPSLLGQVEQQLAYCANPPIESPYVPTGGIYMTPRRRSGFWCNTACDSTAYTITTSSSYVTMCDYFVYNGAATTAGSYTTGNVIMSESSEVKVIWTIWVQGDYQEPQNIWQNWSENVALTQEERERRATLQAEAVRREQEIAARQAEVRKEADAKRAAAEERAKKLLITQLDERQAEQFHKTKTIDVISRHSRRTYRLRYAWAGNVDVISPEGKVIERMCIHPSVIVPMPDHLLAQKLMIEHDEESFRKIANITLVA